MIYNTSLVSSNVSEGGGEGPRLTEVIWFELRAFPIMTDLRHARLANILRVFEGRTISLPARLPMRSSSSSKSARIDAVSGFGGTERNDSSRRACDIKHGLVADRLRQKFHSFANVGIFVHHDIVAVQPQQVEVFDRSDLVVRRKI